MFDNKFTKRDPLAESVRQVMIENDVRRQVELTLNEQLGIQSRKQLPHELHESYDATLNAAIHNALNENCSWKGKMEEGKLANAVAGALMVGAPAAAIYNAGKSPAQNQSAGTVYSDTQRKDMNNLVKKVVSKSTELQKTVKEELKGRQHEIDANHNNRIDANDFKLLRAKKNSGMEEEANVAVGKNPITRKDPNAPQSMEEATEAQQEKVHKTMREFKKHKLHSGSKKGPKVTDPKQAVAIALSQAGLSKKNKEKQVNESVQAILEEIRSNLQEQFVYIYENYDDSVMEQFINSLTEEQAELLGLNEDGSFDLGQAMGDTNRQNKVKDDYSSGTNTASRTDQGVVRQMGTPTVSSASKSSDSGSLAGEPTKPTSSTMRGTLRPQVAAAAANWSQDNKADSPVQQTQISAQKGVQGMLTPENKPAGEVPDQAAAAKSMMAPENKPAGEIPNQAAAVKSMRTTTPAARPAPTAARPAPRPAAPRPSFSGPSGRAGFGDRGSDFGG